MFKNWLTKYRKQATRRAANRSWNVKPHERSPQVTDDRLLLSTDHDEWWLKCPEHEFDCPNVMGRAGHMQAAFGPHDDLRFVRVDTPTSQLHQLAGEARCPPLRLFATIALLRRLREPVAEADRFLRVPGTSCHRNLMSEAERYVPQFLNLMRSHIWLLIGTGSRRLLMSALETYADQGTPQQQSAATSGLIWLRMLALTHWLSDEPRFAAPTQAKKIGEWRLGAHSLYNTPNRLRWQLFQAPEVWLLVYTLMMRSKSELLRGPLRATTTSEQVFVTPPIKEEEASERAAIFWQRVYRILQPTPINPRYMGLYAKYCASQQHVSQWAMTPQDEAFLAARGVKDVLDFGASTSVGKSSIFEVTAYNPWARDAVLPQRPFDALVAYGRLERIPEDELPVLAIWWALFVSPVIALRIST